MIPQHPMPKYRKKNKIMTSSGRSSNMCLQPIIGNSAQSGISINNSQIRMTEEPDSESQKSVNLESSLSKVIMTHKYSSQTRAEQLCKNNGVFQQRNDSSG